MKTKLLIAGLAAAAVTMPVTSQAFEAKISGQVNSAVLFGGDVDDTEVVDNNTSGSRFRFKGSQELENGMKAGFRFEFQDQDNVSSNLEDRDDTEVRYSDVWLSGGFGKIGIGKGDGAANGTFEAYGLINFLGGAESFLLYAGATDLAYQAIDGTSRENRVRYDSPNFGGFSFAASLDNGDREEFAVRYKGDVAGGKLDVRLGDVSEEDITSGSIAYKHSSGIGISYSGAERGDSDESNWLMVGYDFGKTTLSFGTGEYDDADGSDNEMSIFGVNHKPIKGMEIYLNFMDFENADGVDGDVWALGSRIKF